MDNKHPIVSRARRFLLRRNEDMSGVSGTGVVAEGIEFTDGTTVLRWLTHYSSTNIYDTIKSLDGIHGHEGRTIIEWID